MKYTPLTFLSFALMFAEVGCKEDDETTPMPEPFSCPASVTDIDGNSYPVVQIGDRCWTATNLRTTKLNDGTSLSAGLSASQWVNATQAAYAIYNDDPANEAIYGKLYNGHAVKTGKLCPTGWRIPTDDDFKALETHLGMNTSELNQTGERGSAEAIGGKLKSTSLWNDPNTGATNSAQFGALPAGIRNSVGDFITLQQYADFWTSTLYEGTDNYLWQRTLYYNGAGIGRNYLEIINGYSCRCIKE